MLKCNWIELNVSKNNKKSRHYWQSPTGGAGAEILIWYSVWTDCNRHGLRVENWGNHPTDSCEAEPRQRLRSNDIKQHHQLHSSQPFHKYNLENFKLTHQSLPPSSDWWSNMNINYLNIWSNIQLCTGRATVELWWLVVRCKSSKMLNELLKVWREDGGESAILFRFDTKLNYSTFWTQIFKIRLLTHLINSCKLW